MDDQASGSGPTEPDQLRRQLVELVRTLPESHREVVVEHYLNGLTIRSIAERQGLAPARVRDLIHDSRSRLRDALDRRKYLSLALERRRVRRRLLDAVRENQEWIRRLALDLSGSEAVADEVLRKTWAEALVDPPEDISDARAWLRDVVDRLVKRLGEECDA